MNRLAPTTTRQHETSMMQDSLRDIVTRLASDIGERNALRYKALCETAEFLERSLHDTGHEVRRQSYDIAGKTFANLEVEPGGGSPGRGPDRRCPLRHRSWLAGRQRQRLVAGRTVRLVSGLSIRQSGLIRRRGAGT